MFHFLTRKYFNKSPWGDASLRVGYSLAFEDMLTPPESCFAFFVVLAFLAIDCSAPLPPAVPRACPAPHWLGSAIDRDGGGVAAWRIKEGLKVVEPWAAAAVVV